MMWLDKGLSESLLWERVSYMYERPGLRDLHVKKKKMYVEREMDIGYTERKMERQSDRKTQIEKEIEIIHTH